MTFTDDNLKKLKELRHRGVDYIQPRDLEALIARLELAELCIREYARRSAHNCVGEKCTVCIAHDKWIASKSAGKEKAGD